MIVNYHSPLISCNKVYIYIHQEAVVVDNGHLGRNVMIVWVDV